MPLIIYVFHYFPYDQVLSPYLLKENSDDRGDMDLDRIGTKHGHSKI